MKKARVRHFPSHSHIIQIHDEDDEHFNILPPKGYVDLAYRIIGNGPEIVVFVSGMCVSHEMWQFQENSFHSNPMFTLLFIDNRGSGDSSTPFHSSTASSGSSTTIESDSESDIEADVCAELITDEANELTDIDKNLNGYTMDAMSLDIWAIVNSVFNKDTHIHLIGHSMGSMIVQRAALIEKFEHRIASLTLLCGHDGGWFWNMLPSISLMKSGLMLTLANSFNNVIMQADVYLDLHFTSSFKMKNRDKLRKRYINGMNDHHKNNASVWDHYSVVRSHYLSPVEALRLRNRPYPKLVIYGAYDTVVMPRASRQLAGRIGATCIPVCAAHFAMEEAADEINQLIETHVAEAGLLRYVALAKTNAAQHVRLLA